MATIGHTLVGLSLSGLTGQRPRDRAFAAAWFGGVVLLAHLVDIVEWAIILAVPGRFSRHVITESPAAAALLVLAVWVALAAWIGLRRPWPYLIAAAAVFSHLVLDHLRVRVLLADLYESRAFDAAVGPACETLIGTLTAEVWLYGLLLICVALWRAARQRDCPRKGQALAGVLVALSIFAAALRSAVLWIPAYSLAAAHALLLLRKGIRIRLLWNLLPLLPLMALVTTELYSGQLHNRGIALQKEGDYAGALALYRAALVVPTRSQQLGIMNRASICLAQLGDLPAAEAILKQALHTSGQPYWTRFWLARFYFRKEVRGTEFFRPDEAVRLLREIVEGPASRRLKAYARAKLDRLK